MPLQLRQRRGVAAAGPRGGRAGARSRGARSSGSSARTNCTRLQERLEPKPARAPREPAGRQDVRRAGRVVPDDGGRPTKTVPALRIAASSGSGSSRQSSRCSGAYSSERASASSRDATSRTETLSCPATRPRNRDRELAIEAQEESLAVRSVLGLGEQVGGAAGGVGRGVGDHDDLARARPAGRSRRGSNQQLRRRDPAIPGPDDLVDRRDRLRAERERGDRLGAADRVDLVDSERVRRRECRVGAAFGVTTAMRSTPATRAGTAAMTSEDG